MNPERNWALVTGLLFIIATVSAFAGDAILGPVLASTDILATIAPAQARVALGVVVKVISAVTSAGIAISLYPVLRRHSEGLALGSVCLRAIEAVFYLVSVLGLLALLSLGKGYATAGPGLGAQMQVLVGLIRELRTWAGFILAVMAFCLGAGMYYWVLLRTRLVPSWLSVWGLLALGMLLAMVVLILLGGKAEGSLLALAAPIALQEMVLALWLILKGFDAPVFAALGQGPRS